MAARHTQPKCCLLYFNPSPLSAIMLLVLPPGFPVIKKSRVGVLNSIILEVIPTTSTGCSVIQ